MTATFRPSTLLKDYFADADRLVENGVASSADVDTAMRLGAGYPAGPFESRGHTSVADATAPEQEPPCWTRAAVLGTGHMASGIAETVARAGRPVTVIGRSAISLSRSLAAISSSLGRAVARERISADIASTVLGRITFAAGVDDLSEVDLLVEAVAEDLMLKQRLLAAADAALPDDVVLATNTSSFRVSEVMRDVGDSRTTMALHFFNPAPAMRLLEIVPCAGLKTGDETGTAETWARQIGKTPVRSADSRGFIVNRLLIPYLNDAVRLHETGVPIAEIDLAMTEEAGLPMGPFALLDLIGIDVTVAALESMAAAEDIPRLQPANTLYELMRAGRLGRKVGAGFTTKGH